MKSFFKFNFQQPDFLEFSVTLNKRGRENYFLIYFLFFILHLQGCLCPSMWSLQADEKICEPDPSHLSIECNPKSLHFSIDRQIFGLNQDNVTLAFGESQEEKCFSTYKDGFLALNTSFAECGTIASHTETGIIFNNKVAVHSIQNTAG